MVGASTRVLRASGIFALLLFVISALTPIPNAAAGWLSVPAAIAPSDAIVVLGADVNADGELGSSSLRRAIVGMTLFRAGLAPRLVFLGTLSNSASEAALRADLAVQLGLPRDAILTHAGARTTREEAQQTAALLQPRGIRTILLVTDSRHMRRAQYVFERHGFQVRPAPANDFPSAASGPEDRLQLTRIVTQQALALLFYRLTT